MLMLSVPDIILICDESGPPITNSPFGYFDLFATHVEKAGSYAVSYTH